MDDFDLALSQALSYSLKTIETKCREILQDEIDKQVYDKYSPSSYHRTYQLRNNVRTEIKNDILYVYVNTGNMHYKDFDGNDVENYVGSWVNYGHNSNKYTKFMLFQYPSRGFLQESKRRIEQEFGFEVSIMNDISQL